MVAENASFSLYMAHGGTNFGHWSGANGDQTSEGRRSFKPDITSYDYSSPISEAGEHNVGSDGGDLFLAVQAAILGAAQPPVAEPPAPPKAAYGAIQLTSSLPLLDHLAALGEEVVPVEAGEAPLPSFEDLSCWYGLLLYQSAGQPFGELQMSFSSTTLHDRVQVLVDGVEAGTAYRASCPQDVTAPAGSLLQFLVENMGRINYGANGLYDFKGLLAPPPVAGNWSATCIPLRPEQVSALPFAAPAASAASQGMPPPAAGGGGPVFHRGELHLASPPADTFLDTAGWSKGYIWVNGVGLGRYWEAAGPQHTLYLPAPFLRQGSNEIVVLDLHGAQASSLLSVSSPRYTA